MHLESLVDSGWMLLDGWRYRVLQAQESAHIVKRRKCAHMACIARESCASYRNSCR
jgi:hypothetical protein